MRKNVRKVIDAFKLGLPAVGDSKRTIWTDGKVIYSYTTAIAVRVPGSCGKTSISRGDGFVRTSLDYDSYVRINPPIYTRTTNSQIRALLVEFNVTESDLDSIKAKERAEGQKPFSKKRVPAPTEAEVIDILCAKYKPSRNDRQ